MLKRLLLLLMLASPVVASAQSADAFFTPVSYKGAFGGSNWLEGWTALAAKGYLAPTSTGQNTVQVTDASINAGDHVVWTADNIYVLNGVVLVEEGATLTIEPGTTIQGELGNGNQASALVIGRGAKLFAEGTPSLPIVFTSVLDDGSLTYQDRGLWGGVVLLGRATTNNPTAGNEKQIEGLNEIIGTRSIYGGTDDNDSSGILRYLSIRHTGINVGDQAGNEIQGLTLGGVGRGTVIEYIESFASADDGFEFFGGTVDTKYLVSAFNEDDSFDWDEGFRGRGQFWFSLQATDKGGRAGEFDGATNNEFYQPFAIPVLSNVTFIGPGLGATTAGDGAEMIIFRDNSGGKIYNSIFTEYQAASGGKAITVEDVADNSTITTDSRQRIESGDLVLSNNLWWQLGAGNTVNAFATQAWVQAHLAAQPNDIVNPALRGIDRDDPNGTLDPRPAPGSPALSGATASADRFFTPVSYKGAFGGSNWLEGWTALAAKGYLAPASTGQNTVQVTDASINAGDHVVWTADNIYVLNGVVLVEEGATLTIEPGTTIQGELGNGNQASALVIGRGAKLFAEGTPSLPIVFTSVLDDGSLTYQDRGLWGGVVLLGRATTNNPTAGNEKQIEGLNEIIGTRSIYGGTDDNDSSGILRYLSIRHTGINVGDQAGNEIQGLTLGGVGRGTVVEYIESFASADDGFEFFGGTVDTKYLVSAFNEDDSFDWDEGFRGRGQFWFSLQATDKGGRAGEFDGATNNEFYQPFAIPVLSNVTFIGPGLGATTAGDGAEMIIFRDNSGGKIYNSIFTEYQAASGGKAITVEDVADNSTITTDSRQRIESGDLVLSNNLWWQFGAGNTVNAFATQAWVQAHLAAQPNDIVNPALRGIDRDDPNGTLDPRPAPGSPALSGATAVIGTAIEATAGEIPDGFVLEQNWPNPFNPSTTIEFGLDRSEMVRLSVYDLLGREVAVLVNDIQSAGTYRVAFDATELASGVYLYRLATGAGSVSRRMVLMK